ncbi:lipoprotein insertase outer membrane protein LolB [Pasteurella sp. PK-2025]|uniref:lipoprotein insertase outer membrane protein LolB n=1 Tax=Pasteurella sp. PK-2025 TaxID=3413133 RepID=UPI003C77753D
MKLKHALFSICLTSLLSACTLDMARPTHVKYISQEDPTWQQHLTQIQQIKQYSNQGQLGYISEKERFSTRFEWQYQNPANYKLHLSSSISATTLTLEMRNHHLRIFDNKGNERQAKEASHLLHAMIGVEFPLEKFALWLKGQPETQSHYKVGENHLLASFDYSLPPNLWTVDYLSYHQQALPLPKDILIKTEGQTLKIRVDHWKY